MLKLGGWIAKLARVQIIKFFFQLEIRLYPIKLDKMMCGTFYADIMTASEH